MKNFDVITHAEERHVKLMLKGLLVGIVTAFIIEKEKYL